MNRNQRIENEKQFHNSLFSDDRHRENIVKKFYKVAKPITEERKKILSSLCVNSKIIDYGCGKGGFSYELIKLGTKKVTGIDISHIAIKFAETEKIKRGIKNNLNFKIMNAENLKFRKNSYDIICGSGIIHHLDIKKAMESISKVLKPNGYALFIEPLGHNVFINLYRKFTPSIRSRNEHPLLKKDLVFIKKYFKNSKIKYYFLFSIVSSFLYDKPGFKIISKVLNFIDKILLKIPFLKRYAWQVLIVLSNPKKNN